MAVTRVVLSVLVTGSGNWNRSAMSMSKGEEDTHDNVSSISPLGRDEGRRIAGTGNSQKITAGLILVDLEDDVRVVGEVGLRTGTSDGEDALGTGSCNCSK